MPDADDLAAEVLNGFHGKLLNAASSPTSNVWCPKDEENDLSDLDTDEGDLAAGLERELADAESPSIVSEEDSTDGSNAEDSELSEDEEDEDFVPTKAINKSRRPKVVADDDDVSSEGEFAVKARKRKPPAISKRKPKPMDAIHEVITKLSQLKSLPATMTAILNWVERRSVVSYRKRRLHDKARKNQIRYFERATSIMQRVKATKTCSRLRGAT